jgi:hypothetical protein
VSDQPTSKWLLKAFGVPDDGLDVALQLKAGKAFQIRVTDETYGLPPIDFQQRSPDIIASSYGSFGDTVLAVQVKNFD